MRDIIRDLLLAIIRQMEPVMSTPGSGACTTIRVPCWSKIYLTCDHHGKVNKGDKEQSNFSLSDALSMHRKQTLLVTSVLEANDILIRVYKLPDET